MSSIEAIGSPAKPTETTHRFYYGWVVLVMASFAMTATLPGRTHGLGLITKPLIEDPALGISEVLFGTLNFWAILIGATLCLPVGKIIDKFGVRFALLLVSIALGLSVLLMAQANSVWILFAGLTLVRGFGQGALSVVSMAMVGKWFTRRLGIAMAIFTVLLSIGFIASTLGVGGAVKEHGWRPVWTGIGIVLLFGLAPLGWLFVRGTPESIGIAPDEPVTLAETHSAVDLSLRDALTSPAFWAFTLAAALYNLIWSAVTLFSESMMAERGLDNDTYLLVMSMMVAGGLPANLLCGWLAPKVGLGKLLFAGMTTLAGAMVSFPHVQTQTHSILYGLSLGVAGGIVTVVFFTVYGIAFGRANLGAIQGFVQAISVVASATGPLLLAVIRQQTGASASLFYASAPLAILFGTVAWLIPLPKRELSTGSPS